MHIYSVIWTGGERDFDTLDGAQAFWDSLPPGNKQVVVRPA